MCLLEIKRLWRVIDFYKALERRDIMERLFSSKKVSKSKKDVRGYCNTCDVACASSCEVTCFTSCGHGCGGCGGCSWECGACTSLGGK